MTSSTFFLRISRYVVRCLLLFVCTGCAGGIPFWKQQVSSGAPSSPEMAGAFKSLPAKFPESTPGVSETVIPAPTFDSLPRPRQPRPSRFTGATDTSYRNRIITEDTVWQGQVLIEGSLTIAPQVTLAIAPGTTVRFRSTPGGETGFLLIRGRVQAIGTKEAPITFTSDEINPVPGDWQGIMILDSFKKNLLEWCRIEAAVTGVAAEFSDLTLRQTTMTRCRTGASVRSSSVIITGGGASECVTGFFSRDGDADLDAVKFSGNRHGITVKGGSLFLSSSEITGSERSALDATGARLHLEGSSLVKNGAGVTLSGCRGELVGNRIEENRGAGLELAASPLRITGNRITGNGTTGVIVRSGGGTLWDNILERNGDGELAVTGSEDVAAPGNWWGTAELDRIRGRIREGVGGTVLFTPILEAPPRLP
jgi:hypothetical protein